MPIEPADVDSLWRYREAAAGTFIPDAKVANKWADQVHEYYKRLSKTEEGRQGIISLMSDANPHVRLWAASHSLAWVPDSARKVLEHLRDSGGSRSFRAKYVFLEYDAGKLSFEY